MTYRLIHRQTSPNRLHELLIQQPVAAHILQAQSLLRYLDLSPLGPQMSASGHEVWNRFVPQTVGVGRVQPMWLPDTTIPSKRPGGQHFGAVSPEEMVTKSMPTPGEAGDWDRDVLQQELDAPSLEFSGESESVTEEPNIENLGGDDAVPWGQPIPAAESMASRPSPASGPSAVSLPPRAVRVVETVHRTIAPPERAVHAAESTETDRAEGAPLEQIGAPADSANTVDDSHDLPTSFERGNASLEVAVLSSDHETASGVPDKSPFQPKVDAPSTASPTRGLAHEAASVAGISAKPGDDPASESHAEGMSRERRERDMLPITIPGPASGGPPAEKHKELARDDGAPSQPLASEVEFAAADLPQMRERLVPENGVTESDDPSVPAAVDREVAHPESEPSVLRPAPPRAYDLPSADGPAATHALEPSTTRTASVAETSTPSSEEQTYPPGTLISGPDEAPDRTLATVGETDDSVPETPGVEDLFDAGTVDRSGGQTDDHYPHEVQEAKTVLSPARSRQPVEIRVARRVGRLSNDDSKDTGWVQPETAGSRTESPAAGPDTEDDTGSTQITVEGNVVPKDGSERRSSLSAHGPVDAAMDELFAARGQDRSPQAWLVRLQQAALDEEHGASRQSPISSDIPTLSAAAREDIPPRSKTQPARPASTPPTPLPDSTRRFLRPLVGMDPSLVQVHRDERAAEITQVVKADALAVGDTVILNPDRSLETPESIGLLAHEFTHIARRRAPRFVPPIVRGRAEIRQPGGAAMLSEDEVLARQVEAAVTTAARFDNSPAMTFRRSHVPGGSEAQRAEAAATGSTRGSGHTLLPSKDPWNGLPAPWESFPSQLADPAPTRAHTVDAAAAASSVDQGAPAAVPQVLPAAQGRELSEEAHGSPVGPGAHQGAPVEPDLDLLARQVYSILKRRLDVERRRTG